MKKEHFLQSEGFKTVAASVLSILIGLAVGSIVILIVGLTSPNLLGVGRHPHRVRWPVLHGTRRLRHADVGL